MPSSSSASASSTSLSPLALLRRKLYQYEVTYSLYMLTPTEKVIFNTFLLFFLALLVAAIALYLPQHVTTIARRAYFYYAGDESVIGRKDEL